MVTSEIKLGLVLAGSTPRWAMAHTYPAPPLRASNIAPPPPYSIVFVYFSSSVCNARPACNQYWYSSTSFSTRCILLYFCIFVFLYFLYFCFCSFIFGRSLQSPVGLQWSVICSPTLQPPGPRMNSSCRSEWELNISPLSCYAGRKFSTFF